MSNYKPMFLSWCKSYQEEEKEMRKLIESSPADEKQLRKEYQLLTSKQFRRSK